MVVLLDSGILLRLLDRSDPLHTSVRAAVGAIKARGDALAMASQNVAKFWNLCTRPASARGVLDGYFDRGKTMLTSSDVQAKIKQRPFEPFRIIMSSGDYYDVKHPDLALVGKRHVFVGTASEDNPTLFDRSSLLSVLHIAALEALPVEAPPEKNGQQ